MLTAVLAALLNLSTLVANQPKIARRGLTVLLKTNSSMFQVVSSRVSHVCVGAPQISADTGRPAGTSHSPQKCARSATCGSTPAVDPTGLPLLGSAT